MNPCKGNKRFKEGLTELSLRQLSKRLIICVNGSNSAITFS